MKFEWNFFQSKVTRRIFLLFILSAFIPVLIIAVFQLTQMRYQLNERSVEQVRQNVKNIGMELIGRLFHLENQITLLATAIKHLPIDVFQSKTTDLVELSPDFSALTLYNAEEEIVLKGKPIKRPEQLPIIPSGQTWIFLQTKNDKDKSSHVNLVHRVNDQVLLFGQIKTIGQFNLNSDALFWILGSKQQPIKSNTAIALPDKLKQFSAKKDSDVFSWKLNQTSYYVGYWSLFLKQRLLSDNWIVVFAVPKSSVLKFVYDLYPIFLPTLFLALLLTMLLSQFLIRRSLVPLEKLREATRRIAKRDFKTPVKVESDDEFRELGESFNTMAKRLDRQFQTLALLSQLDKIILTNRSGEYVLKIIFKRLKEIIDYELLILGFIDKTNKTHSARLIIDDNKNPVANEKVKISLDELTKLKSPIESLFKIDEDPLPSYFSKLKHYNIEYFLLYPVLHKNEPKAFIGLGFKKAKAIESVKDEKLHDIFYRASVAYTHAEWEELLFHQAHYDDLTNLPNRLMLRDEMSNALERAYHKKNHCVLLFIDLDNFKDVNDALGHSVGDYFLEKVAARMQKVVSQDGVLARIGGDEFALFITDVVDRSEACAKAQALAKKLLQAFDEPFYLKKMTYHATASIGIAMYPDDCKSSDELLKFADMSMYKAKEKGKEQYVFFSRNIESVVSDRNQLIQEMYMALEAKQFKLYFQPKVDSRTNSLVGAEALIRWQHPTRGVLPPDVFLPLAEESSLIFPIGEWVIQTACEQLDKWQKQGLNLPSLAINLAAKQFGQRNLIKKIKMIIEQTAISPEMLEFEITESALIESVYQASMILNQLQELGCRLSIDDFGTGYSSMYYLRRLPLHTMKIDRVFIQGLPQDKKNVSIIKAIITLATSLEKRLVAEGIETKAQSELLSEFGCFIQQGYYFSQPLSSEAFHEQFLI